MVEINLLNLLIAFLAGVLTFFAGCVAPIVPVYLGYLSGVSIDSLRRLEVARFKAFFNGLFFVAGFVGVFMLLGLTVNSLARMLGPYRSYIDKVGGVMVIILGLYFLNVLKVPFLSKERGFHLGRVKGGKPISGFLMGLIFGFAWTPCIGPVLATILVLSSLGQNILSAVILMAVFGIGLATPFLLIALLFDKLTPQLSRLNKYLPQIQKITGVLIILIGVLLITGYYTFLSRYFLGILGSSAFVLEFR
ncbi:sulfite exporter TauE/SafE family protein [Candidatus Daviesbacteria bacterium]|nr:sulfite exporter TauE/SafE family protein [Candidatus Daviesbacteria bacterium]